MLEERNKAIARRWIDAMDTGNLAVVDELFSADFVDHVNILELGTGREGFKQAVSRLRAAFSGPHYAVQHLIADGDMVIIHGIWRDTAIGDLPPTEPNGGPAALREIAIYCIIDGLIVERWSALDQVAFPQQFDAILVT